MISGYNSAPQDVLLQTKLYAPRPRRRLVNRPRLLDRLSRGLARGLTLVSAPAGFGKTTLVSEWLQQVNRPSAWLSLDENDNDPYRFLTHLAAACRQVYPEIGPLPAGFRQQPPQALLTALVNNLAAPARDAILVLDDFHIIEAGSVHQAVAFLLDHRPDHLHLVIISRADPPLPLARLRARHQLMELRAADLRFTPTEAAAFLNRVMGLNLPAKDIDALESRTEGWIAGLQLAALSIQARPDSPGFINTFTGSHHYVLDYLAEEVLHRQPESVRRFLLQTAILNRLSGPLCDAVTGQTGSRSTLARLEQANLFIIPLDDERRWYRYHHLFADFLRQRLPQSVPPLPPPAELHRRAAAWYQQNGWPTEALGHALAGADVARATRLIEQSSQTMLRRSEMAILLNWLASLPDELVRDRPRLSLFHAWALVLSGQLETLEARLQQSGAALDKDETAAVPGELTVIRATAAYFRRDLPQTIRLCRTALAELPPENLFLRNVVAMSLATACHAAGHLHAAARAFEQGQEIGIANRNIYMALIAACNLAQLRVEQARLSQAAEIYHQALPLVDRHTRQGHMPAVAGRVYIGLGKVLYRQNSLEAAAQHLQQGLDTGRQTGDTTALMAGYLAMARLKQAQHNFEAAAGFINRAEELAQEQNLPSWTVRLAAARVRLCLQQGQVKDARRWLHTTYHPGFDDSAGYDDELGRVMPLVQARLSLAQGRPDDALAVLDKLYHELEQTEKTGPALEVRVLQALACHARGNTVRAVEQIGQALAVAGPEGDIRLFVDEGPAMAALLQQAEAAGVPAGYAQQLLAAFEAEPSPPPVPGPPLIEPLSDRELDILRLTASGMSNRQIAAALVVSEGTVKWHLNNIYGKLGVHSRTQAVARGRELHLI